MTISFADSLARTASGNGATIEGLGVQTTLRVQLEVTAAAGTTPTLDVVLEDTIDGVNWNTLQPVFAQKVAAGREVINIITPFTGSIRARWTIGGSAGQSFTFSIQAYAE